MIFVYSTFPSKKEAKEIGERLVKNRLAACINIFPIDSVYFWTPTLPPPSRKRAPGKIVKDKEFAAFIKTRKENFKEIEKFILKNHSYTTPCILEIPIGRVAKKFLKWLNENC